MASSAEESRRTTGQYHSTECPCGYDGELPMDLHMLEDHDPEDFGLAPLRGDDE